MVLAIASFTGQSGPVSLWDLSNDELGIHLRNSRRIQWWIYVSLWESSSERATDMFQILWYWRIDSMLLKQIVSTRISLIRKPRFLLNLKALSLRVEDSRCMISECNHGNLCRTLMVFSLSRRGFWERTFKMSRERKIGE